MNDSKPQETDIKRDSAASGVSHITPRRVASLRWFWIGMAASIPTAWLLGADRHTETLVTRFSISYILLISGAAWIFRTLKKLRNDELVFKSEKSLIARLVMHSTLFAGGHGIGFLTIATFF